MSESRKPVGVWVLVLLFGLAVGMAHAEDGSADEMSLAPASQPVMENSVADFANDSNMADTEIFVLAVEPDCALDTTLPVVLSPESGVPSQGAFGWTCGSCSISACANRPVGTPCGFGRYCVVTTVCTVQPLTERCVCGFNHA